MKRKRKNFPVNHNKRRLSALERWFALELYYSDLLDTCYLHRKTLVKDQKVINESLIDKYIDKLLKLNFTIVHTQRKLSLNH